MSYLKIMFWLFKRKKVADKKAITPCVCDNGDPLQDSLNLQDFGIRSPSDSVLCSKLHGSLGGGGGGEQRTTGHKGYQRLERTGSSGPSSDPDEITVLPPTPDRPLPPPSRMSCRDLSSSCSESGSSSSSEEKEDEYFEGFTDTDDEEEELTCNFCERSFRNARRLEQHQQRKRHYMCSVCDSAFDGLMLLEAHKETLDHWSDYELRLMKRAAAAQPEDEDEEDDDEPAYRGRRRRRGDELRRLLL